MSCRQQPDKPWNAAIPSDVPALITTQNEASLSLVLREEYISILDDISNSAIPVIQEITNAVSDTIQVKAILLVPHSSRSLQPVWITQAPENTIALLKEAYYRDFKQNYYKFNGITIHRLFISERMLFVARAGRWLLISESSFGVEESLRAYLGRKNALELPDEARQKAGLVINTPHLEKWIKQLTEISYYPALDGLLKGTKPAFFSVRQFDNLSSNIQHEFNGNIPLDVENASYLAAALSYKNSPLQLDRYVSENAAAFAILKFAPPAIPPPADSLRRITPLDSLLINDEKLYKDILKTLDSEFAFVSYDESGYLSEGEELYLRHLKDFQKFYDLLKGLEREGFVEQDDTIFYVRSRILARLIGSPMSTISEFYLTNAYKAAVMATRRGRAESVKADRSRRRVIYYDENYLSLRESFPDEMSGFAAGYNRRFLNYLQPILAPDNYVSTLMSGFDFFTMTFQKAADSASVMMSLKTYNLNRSNQPYEERWVFPFDNQVEVTARPTLADIGGSSRNEVIFSTSAGDLFALATDGTIVMQAGTGLDIPVGSPIVYDWYGNNQSAILQAAGNKIYAWNTVGQSLPQFPLSLPETISAPPVVADINRDGIPELIVATQDRNVHVIDGRGNDLEGWPQPVNAAITNKIRFEQVGGEWSVWAFANNTLHSWRPDGSVRNGFPVFINAPFRGSPLVYKNHIIGNAADGHLYAIGTQPLFADSLNVLSSRNDVNSAFPEEPDSVKTEAVYISNSSLEGTPKAEIVSLISPEDSTAIRESVFVTMSNSGSVFLVNEKGKLRFTRSMGQPVAPNFDPLMVDLNNNKRPDIVALANFGRLYAWDVYTGERIYELPATGMSHLIISDFENDGRKELVAETREGLRSWTLTGNGN